MTIAGPYSALKILHHGDRMAALRAGGHPAPLQIQLILSDRCNQDCQGCAYRLEGYTSNALFAERDATGAVITHNPHRMLATDLAWCVLDDCAAMGVRAVQFTGGGEPTLHPAHPALFQRALALGLDIALVTNGLILRAGVAEILARATWVRVSIDAGTQETYARTRRTPPGAWEVVWRHVGELAAARDAALPWVGMELGVGFVVTRDNYREVGACAALARAAGATNIRISALFTPDDYAYHAPIHEAATRAIEAAREQYDGPGFRVLDCYGDRIGDLCQQAPEYRTCRHQQLVTYLGGDGNLYRCCVLAYNPRGLLGSVADAGSFRAVWESAAVREDFSAFDARGCARCQFNGKNRVLNYACATDPEHVNFV